MLIHSLIPSVDGGKSGQRFDLKAKLLLVLHQGVGVAGIAPLDSKHFVQSDTAADTFDPQGS